MKVLLSMAVVSALVICQSHAMGSRCAGYPEAQIVFCDDFDQYCTANNPANPWPGYPPTPDTACPTTGATPDTSFFTSTAHWPGSCYNTMTVGTNGWGTDSDPFYAQYTGGGVSAQYHRWDVGASINAKNPLYDRVNGTDEHPLYVRFFFGDNLVGSPPNSPLYLELAMDEDRAPTDYVIKDCLTDVHDCSCAPANADATCSLNVCDTNTMTCAGGPKAGSPCDVDYDCSACVGGAIPNQYCRDDRECQVPCGAGQQSTCEGGPYDGTACSQDSQCTGSGPVYPIVNQQVRNGSIGVPHPGLSTTIRNSIAFGQLAQLDPDPCNLETGKKPTVYHAATFDGLKWWDLRSNMFPGNGQDFNNDGRSAVYQIWIKTNEYVVHLDSMVGPDNQLIAQHSEATIPRQYKGPFNRIAIGTGPGCQLDPATGNCLTEPACFNYPREWPVDTVMWHTYGYDNIVVMDGVLTSGAGACCYADTSCAVVDPANCTGVFKGPNTTCETVACCPPLYGDAVRDGMVDMSDFAALQQCLSSGLAPIQAGCECWDYDNDKSVGSTDVEHFILCANGPGIPGNLSAACKGTGW